MIAEIQLQIKPYLNQSQYLKLTQILIDNFDDIEIIYRNKDLIKLNNNELLKRFLSAKEVEGCSKKTIKYYRKTIKKNA